MYIEFRLPQGSGGQAAAYANYLIVKELRAWSDQYRIPYRSKIIKYVKRVTFDDDTAYSFFAMTSFKITISRVCSATIFLY